MEVELEFAQGLANGNLYTLQFHPNCFEEWDLARAETNGLEAGLHDSEAELSLIARERETCVDP